MDEMTIGAKIELNTKDFDRGISNAQKNLKGFEKQTVNLGKSLGDSVKKSTQSINDGLKNWGVNFDQFFDKGSSILSDFGLDIEKLASHFGMSGKLIAGIIAVTSALEKMGQAMDEATAEIVKGTGATGEALQGLEQSARNAMIGGLGATAQDVAGIVADLNTRFGSTGEELTELADTFDMFAGVTGQDTRQAINDVADTMLKWGVDVKHSTKLLDELTKAGQDSGASVSSLTNDLKSGQAIFQQFGMSIEDSLAFLANLKRNGLESSTALTAMRTAMANFTAQGISAKEGFEQVGEAIKNATSDTEAMQIALSTFGNRGGADMVKVFRSGAIDIKDYSDALKNATDVMANTDEASRTASDAMDDLKATLMGAFGQFGQAVSEPFRDIIDIVRELFSVVAPTFDAIGGYVRTLFTTVSGSVKKIVVMIVDLAKRMNVSGSVLGKILNQMGKTFGKVFGGIVWVVDKAYRGIAIGIDYIKIGLTKLGKGLSDIFGPIIEGFTKGFNKIIEAINSGINKYNGLIDSLGLNILKVQTVQPINVGDLMLGEEEANARIAELQADIDRLLGRTEATAIETSQAVFGSFDSAISEIERESGNASEAEQKRYADLIAWEDKLINQKIQNIELEKKNEVQRLKNAEASAEQIEGVEKKYNDMIIALKEKLIEHERQKELEAVKDTENSAQAKAKINEYYDKQRQALHAETVDAIVKEEQKIVDKTQEWTDKIRGLQGDVLTQEENALLLTAETEEEKTKIKEEYIKKRLALALAELAIEEARAKSGANNDSEIEAIEEYYRIKRGLIQQDAQNQLEANEGKTEEISIWTKIKEACKKAYAQVVKYLKVAKNIAKVYIVAGKVAVKAFSTSVKAIGKLVSTVGNVFSKLFEFNNDEMLNSLLEFEDKILTFFTSGASQIPAFVKSVIDSVDVLVGNIENLINPEGIANALDDMISYAVDKLPSILTKIVQIASTLVQTVAKTIGDNADGLVSAIGSVIMALVRELPNLAKTIIPAILNIFTSIGKWISDNAEEFGKIISETISSIIDGIVDFIQGGGLKTVLTAIISAYKAILKAIADNIDPFVNAIIDALPDIVDAIADFIKSTNEVLPKIVKAILKLILAIIDAVAEMFDDDEMFQSIIDATLEIVVAIIQAIIQAIPKLVNLIVKAVFQIIRNLPYIIKEIVKAIISIFKDMDWSELGKSILEIFKSIFSGIGSVAKTWAGNFVDFGKNMIKGLWKGISSFGSWIWNHVKNFFKDFLKKIKKFFGIHSPSTVFADIGGNMIKGLWNGIKNLGSWLKDNVLKLFQNLLNGIKSVFSKVGDFFSDLWDAIKDGASDGVENVKKFFGGLGEFFSGACSNIKNFFSNLWDGIKNGASDVVSRVKEAFSGIGEFFSGVCSNVGNFFSNLWGGIRDGASTAVSKVKEFFSGLGNFFSGVCSNIGNFFSGLWSGIKSGAESAGNFIKSVFSGIGDFFKTVFSGIGDFFGNVFSGMQSKLSDFTSTVSSGVGTVISKVQDFGQTVGSGIKTGVQTVGSGIKSTVEKIGSGIKSGVKSAGSKIKKFFGFATGVNNAPRGLSLVGEQGPELVDMRGGERVYTAQNTRDILSNAGRSNSFNVTFNNTQDTTAFAMMRQLKAYNRQMKLNGVF